MNPPVLAIRDLRLAFRSAGGMSEVLHGISLHVRAREKVALVGESGSGKSVTARLTMGLLQGGRGVHATGSIRFAETEMVHGGPAVDRLRGSRVAMIPQDPTSALNPTFKIRGQFRDVQRSARRAIADREADAAAEAALGAVQIEDPRRVLGSYAFQLSGGMNQRVMIAMALINRPELLIADEPGTALDVTVQAQTLKLMHDLTERTGTAVLLISHNLGVVREFCDRVYVIYRGRLVEHGATGQLFANPAPPLYPGAARGDPEDLGGPAGGRPRAEPGFRATARRPSRLWRARRARGGGMTPILELDGVGKTFRAGGYTVVALDDVSLSFARGECHAIVGESGSGKTTLGNLVLGLFPPTAGTIRFQGSALPAARPRALTRAIQLVQQNPLSALNPRRSVGASVRLPLDVHRVGPRRERAAKVEQLLDEVGLEPRLARRSPRGLSGGERQRIAIARALAAGPELIVLDEPTSSLDVLVQARVLNLLNRLRREHRLTYLFITHDLAVVRADRRPGQRLPARPPGRDRRGRRDLLGPEGRLHPGTDRRHPCGHRAGGGAARRHPRRRNSFQATREGSCMSEDWPDSWQRSPLPISRGRASPLSSAIARRNVGAQIFTVMVRDNAAKALRSASLEPSGGISGVGVQAGDAGHLVEDRWSRRREPFLANTIEAIAEVFPDHELIKSLGCASVVNVPIVFDDAGDRLAQSPRGRRPLHGGPRRRGHGASSVRHHGDAGRPGH